MKSILLVGGGGHCQSVIEAIESTNQWKIMGLIDREEKIGESCLGYEIIGADKDLASLRAKCSAALITVGQIKSPATRIALYNQIKELGYELPVVVASTASVSKHATIGEGSVILHHAFVNAGAKIGSNCIINSRALVEHNTQIGSHCHISTGACINGDVVVEEGVFIGSGAIIKENIKIGANSIIGMGVRVFKSVSAGSRCIV